MVKFHFSELGQKTNKKKKKKQNNPNEKWPAVWNFMNLPRERAKENYADDRCETNVHIVWPNDVN